MTAGMVCGIVLRATSLPSTDRTPVPPFAWPGPSFEVKYDCVFARRERLWALPAEALQSQQVVGEDWLPLEQVEAVTAEAASKRVEHTFGTLRRNLYISCDLK